MNSLCIIPARGGSKRIPRKNIKSFLGQPIIEYSIKAALNSGLFAEVMVSTDDDEIAGIALQAGAKIPFRRSDKNADDYATTVDVVLEVLDNYCADNQHFTSACCIYPTAPFITSKRLQSGFSLLQKGNYDSVFPVLPFSFPIQRAVKINSSKRIELFQPEHQNSRSQDLEKAYHDAGQFYWFKTAVIQTQKKLWTDNSGVLVVSEMEAQDIDTVIDWQLAELKFQLKQSKDQQSNDLLNNNKPRVYFRADGNAKMGLGHVFRSLALAEMLAQDFHCTFIIRQPLPILRQQILEICDELLELPTSDTLSEAKYLTTHHLESDDIIVLDGYHFTTDYQQVIKNTGTKVVCIDDIKSYHFVADAVINHAGGLTPMDYSTADDTVLFLGLEYALLRQPFRVAAAHRQSVGNTEHLFICLGGADPKNDTLAVLQHCEKIDAIVQIHLVLGGAYLHENALKDYLSSSNLRITIHRNLDAEQMVALMQQCGTAITPPSTIAYEYLSVGGTLFLKVIADNQLNINRYFLETGLAFSFEKDFMKIKNEQIEKALEQQRIAFDGQTQARYLELFHNLKKSKPVAA